MAELKHCDQPSLTTHMTYT